MDKDGNEISPSETISGAVGAEYETKAKDIEGWVVNTIPENAKGTFTNETQEILYVYDVKKGSAIIKYVDKDGNEISPSETISGAVGAEYETKAKDIEGWVVNTIPENAKGTFTNETQEILYVYDVKKGNLNTVIYSSNKKNNQNNLPKTGETKSLNMKILGSILVILALLVSFYKFKINKSKSFE